MPKTIPLNNFPFPSPSPQATNIIVYVSISLNTLDISYKWEYTIFVFLWLKWIKLLWQYSFNMCFLRALPNTANCFTISPSLCAFYLIFAISPINQIFFTYICHGCRLLLTYNSWLIHVGLTIKSIFVFVCCIHVLGLLLLGCSLLLPS